MEDLLADRPAWFVLGPAIGLTVVGLLAFANVRIGVLGGWSEIVSRATGRAPRIGWKGWFVLGVVLGAVLFRLLGGPSTTGEGYGWISRAFDDAGLAIAAVLVAAGILIGYGAKTAGGCTSGNGLGATSFGSPAGFVSVATFMGTAVIASFAIQAVT